MSTRILIPAALMVIAGAFGNYLRFIEQRPERAVSFDVIPLETNGYTGSEHRFSEMSYEVLQADTTTLRTYLGPDGRRFWLFIAYFESQKYGSQIHSPKHCLPGGGWKIERLEHFSLPLPGDERKKVNRVIIREREQHQLMFYWFETRGGAIRSEFGLKLDLMRNSLLFRPTDAAIVRLTVPIGRDDNVESVTAEAIRFFETFYPAISAALPFTDQHRFDHREKP
jgi:EpsI family protein